MTTKVASRASKKATPLSPVHIISRLCSYNNITETDFDQPTNYSLLYAEENSVIEEVSHFEHLAGGSDQENTVTTYYTEGTPFQTPLRFSTATSTSDLLKLDDSKICHVNHPESKEYITPNQFIELIKENLERSRERDSSDTRMEFENKYKERGNTDAGLCLPDDSKDFDDICDEERSEGIINVTPSQSPVELCDEDREGKIVIFEGEDHYPEQSPLMFSRCSSLGSLSGFEQQLLHDDHSSVISDFSRRTSEVVSPSDLPDSPAHFISTSLAQQKDNKVSKKKVQQQKDKIQSSEISTLQQEIMKQDIFYDDTAVFEEELTPLKFHSMTANSLSPLTIDDDDDDEERDQGEVENKAGAIKNLKMLSLDDQLINETEKSKKIGDVQETHDDSYLSADEEKIFDEYIRKRIAKVTRQHINDVSLNIQASPLCHSKKPCQIASQSSFQELFDENCDLTAEEKELLDECIRRGIARITQRNRNGIESLNLRSSPTFSSSAKCGKNFKQEKRQQKHEELEKRPTVCQAE